MLIFFYGTLKITPSQNLCNVTTCMYYCQYNNLLFNFGDIQSFLVSLDLT